MKVVIGDKLYNPDVEPILFILNESDKENIKNMHEKSFKYLCAPEHYQLKDLQSAMERLKKVII